jgi:hypothetical protein
MKKIPFGFLLILFFTNQIFAQKSLLFLNTKTSKTIEVSEGQTLSIQYRGYNNQLYHYKNTVTEINDSSIVLGNIAEEPAVWIQKISKKYEPNYRVVAIKDIVSFRRITLGRILGKSLISTTFSVGSIFAFYGIINNSNGNYFQAFFISLGIGMLPPILNSFILPENPVNKIKNDWIVTVRN